jgi:hypothetical protein
MNISNLTPQQLRKAADLKERIDGLQDQLNRLLGGQLPAPAQVATEAPEEPANGRRKKRKKVSAEARARMAASQRARWAAKRGEVEEEAVIESEAPAATEPEKPKKKRNISEAGRRAMSLAGKRRWATLRAAKKKARGKAKSDVPF